MASGKPACPGSQMIDYLAFYAFFSFLIISE
jgi:hypothetical protein